MSRRKHVTCGRCNTVAFAAATHCWACLAELPALNVCEHGDHPAPDGVRFCSDACADCDLGVKQCGRCRLDETKEPSHG